MNEPALTRLQHLMSLREEVENLNRAAPWQPTFEWADEGTHLTLYLDVPGVDADSLEMLEEESTVTVAGERRPVSRVLRGDRPGGAFVRTLSFPEEIVPQSAEASLTAGVLQVRFLRKHPTIDMQATELDTPSE